MSMPMLGVQVILDVKYKIAEEEMNLFPISLMNTTMQDGSTRERKD